MTKAYSYIRFSTGKQLAGDSLRRQTELASSYALRNKLELDEQLTFRDLGVSAFKGANSARGELGDFLTAVKKGRIKRGSYLLVESLDRLSRDQVVPALENLLAIVRTGIIVITLQDEKRWDETTIQDPMNLMVSILLMSRAHEESATKSKRVMASYAAKRQRGEPVGNTAHGWLVKGDDGTWKLDREKAIYVCKAFKMAAAGAGAVLIADFANSHGWPLLTRRLPNWSADTVRRMLRDRACIGEHQVTVLQGQRRVALGEPILNYYPTVVTPALFALTQASIDARQRLPRRSKQPHHNPLSGLAVCGNCGRSMHYKADRRRNKHYFVCHGRATGQSHCPNWPADELMRLLWPPLLTLLADELASSERMAKLQAQLAIQKLALKSAGRRIKRHADAFENDDEPPPASLVSRLRDAEAEQERARIAVEQLKGEKERMGDVIPPKVLSRHIKAAIAATQATGGDVKEKERLRTLLAGLVKRITLWPRDRAAVSLLGTDLVVALPFTLSGVPAELLVH